MFCNLPFCERLSENLYLINSGYFIQPQEISVKCYFFIIIFQRVEIQFQFLLAELCCQKKIHVQIKQSKILYLTAFNEPDFPYKVTEYFGNRDFIFFFY